MLLHEENDSIYIQDSYSTLFYARYIGYQGKFRSNKEDMKAYFKPFIFQHFGHKKTG